MDFIKRFLLTSCYFLIAEFHFPKGQSIALTFMDEFRQFFIIKRYVYTPLDVNSHVFLFRAINYDEKDPFLCTACGFCKYGKFDYTVSARPCCAVDPIENEEDRQKAVTNINSLLEKADRVYRQLVAHKPTLEVSQLPSE